MKRAGIVLLRGMPACADPDAVARRVAAHLRAQGRDVRAWVAQHAGRRWRVKVYGPDMPPVREGEPIPLVARIDA